MEKFSYLKSINAGYIDELFERYTTNPDSLDETWRYFFEGMELGNETEHTNGAIQGHTNGAAPTATPTTVAAPSTGHDIRIFELIHAYREWGRLIAQIDPLHPSPTQVPQLELSRFGLSTADLDKTFSIPPTSGFAGAQGSQMPLKELLARLQETYSRSIGVEMSHIQNIEARRWLQQRLESSLGNDTELTNDTKKFILKRLTESDGFERFLHTRYVAQKRFSIEGADAMIPAMDCLMETAAELGAKEFVLGMAHRGRLNVLTNLCGKKAEFIFTEFEGHYKQDDLLGESDVKYHKGYSADLVTRKDKKVHLSLSANPSHLEFVNPVVEGMARAKQDRLKDKGRSQVIPILIHGDAAIAGQGVVYETLSMSQVAGYSTGGTIHYVINNLVGFTADPDDTRSTPYCTDLAKMLDGPIFHVNGDDPEALWFATKVCVEYRQKFKTDTFIDLICYRRQGHNEGDEPSFTQPILYKKIKAHPTTREIYLQKLIATGVTTAQEGQSWVDDLNNHYLASQKIAREQHLQPFISAYEGAWKGLKRATAAEVLKPAKTAVDEKTLQTLSRQINTMPAGFHLHSKLGRFFEARAKAITDGQGIDWGNGEALGFATLLAEGHSIRLSGQDAGRGTFTHRHAILHDFETGEIHVPLAHVAKDSAFSVYNSVLSETGVMGFDFGYSWTDPSSLVIWEAQFGDFANGAQVIIDQFISSSEMKWQRSSGLVLLLPHGYEGQGAEHSSARLERFLTLCAKNNIFVCYPTTPAQIFHLLRRQLKWKFRKPCVVMSPKSLLRHPMAISKIDEFTKEGFQEVIDDSSVQSPADAKKVKKVLLCSGKVYYDLLTEQQAKKKKDVAVVRVEQFYPWPEKMLSDILNRYSSAKDLVWVQEEPRNMGGWSFIFNRWAGGTDSFSEKVGSRTIRFVGREASAAPACGNHHWHEEEQKALVKEAFGD